MSGIVKALEKMGEFVPASIFARMPMLMKSKYHAAAAALVVYENLDQDDACTRVAQEFIYDLDPIPNDEVDYAELPTEGNTVRYMQDDKFTYRLDVIHAELKAAGVKSGVDPYIETLKTLKKMEAK